MLQAQPCPSRVRPVPAVSLRIWPLTLEPGQRFLQRSNRQPFQVVHLPCKPSLINTVLNCTTPLRCFLIVCSLFYCSFLPPDSLPTHLLQQTSATPLAAR